MIRAARLSKLCAKWTKAQEELQYLGKMINTTKNTKIINYTPVIWGKTNCRLDKAKFNSLRIILDYGIRSPIILGKHTQELQNKTTKKACWITQGVNFNTDYTGKLETVLPELDATKIVTWNFHVDD